ncbi:hypothetical protein [Streptomyces sp. NBRC 109706]|uniref:hypothetical protein n=1 Tax=Streptomyces sp. NBRC 109706 TaxID=1550035 RepID=UPI000AD99DA4|nr:hypothetical protein [Streptomyces sp. NBRC 109706]
MSEHTPMSPERLAAIAARAEAATPGPWQYDYADREVMTGHGIAVADIHPADDDGRFIAHTREDVDALLAEVERLRDRVDEVERRYTFDTADLKQQRDAARAVVAEQQDALSAARPSRQETATRAAVLREAQDATVAWLVKKAGEERSVAMQEEKRRATARARHYWERAELISTLADKVSRGAVRPFLDAAPLQPTRAEVLREAEARLLLHAERLESAVWAAAARVVASMADEADTAGGGDRG